MKTYDIYVTKRGVEHYSVRANSPEEALQKREEGTASLKGDQTTDVEEIQVIDRATGKDVTPAEPEEDHGPVLKTYGVRCWATFRASADTQVEAFNQDGAIAVAKTMDWSMLNFFANIDDFTVERDETAQVFGPADDGSDHDDPWQGDGLEVDLRAAGEPFSWDAVGIVKELAELGSIHNPSYRADKINELIAKAQVACASGTDEATDAKP